MRLSLSLCALACVCFASAQTSVKDSYQKYEYEIPMRDGVKLYAQVYVPKTVSGKHPILMERTCYGAGPKGADRYKGFGGSIKLRQAGYIFAYSDVRGKGYSEGDFVNVRPQLKPGEKGIDESTDTYDTIDYLVKHVPQNNGKVGLWGISYPGFYAGVGAINSHPNLAAISPQAPVSNWFYGDDVHHNGAFFTQDSFDFSLFFDVPRGATSRPSVNRAGKTAYQFYLENSPLPKLETNFLKGTIPYWNELMDHGTYDQYWKDRALPDHMKNVKCAVLTVGGLFDAEDMWGAMNLYQYVERQNRGIANTLVLGPWFHGGWAGGTGHKFGDIDFGSDVSTYYRDEIEFPFFEKYLRDQDVPAPAEATVFNTGANTWRRFDVWPPRTTAKADFYVGSDRALTSTPGQAGEVSYVNDPAKPTPYTGEWETSKQRPSTYMLEDQRWAEKRSDVATFTGPVLPDDLTVVGKVNVDFWVKTTGTDTDFVVKVIDVFPSDDQGVDRKGNSMAGYEMLVRGDIMRGKFRNSFEKPEPFVPGKPTRLHFALNELLHTFKKGHKVMIQVQSDWFPLVDRNPNAFVDIYRAKDSDFQPATVSILTGSRYPSKMSVAVLK